MELSFKHQLSLLCLTLLLPTLCTSQDSFTCSRATYYGSPDCYGNPSTFASFLALHNSYMGCVTSTFLYYLCINNGLNLYILYPLKKKSVHYIYEIRIYFYVLFNFYKNSFKVELRAYIKKYEVRKLILIYMRILFSFPINIYGKFI